MILFTRYDARRQHQAGSVRGRIVLIIVMPGDEVLKELIDTPGDRRRWHHENNARRHATEEAGQPTQPMNCLDGIDNAANGMLALSESALLLRVEQRLADVERRRSS